jgi:hypothetical protein
VLQSIGVWPDDIVSLDADRGAAMRLRNIIIALVALAALAVAAYFGLRAALDMASPDLG